MKNYIGMDFHLQHSSIAVMDKNGNITEETKLYHNKVTEIKEFFEKFPKNTDVAIEATRNWYWMIDLLESLNMHVRLVNPKKTRIIAESTIKTDKIDARILAHLTRCNFLPEAYIADKETRDVREMLRYYMHLVRVRASLKNRIHSLLAKNNLSYLNHGFTDLFGKLGREFLKTLNLSLVYRDEMDGYLEIIDTLTSKIVELKKDIKKIGSKHRYVPLLTTIPGIGDFGALVLAAEIGEIERFSNAKKLSSYAGLTSTTRQSAEKTWHGSINKDSNKYIRYILVEAVQKAIMRDRKLWEFFQRIKEKKGRGSAVMATARKISIAIYSMLRKNESYRTNEGLR